MKQSNRLVATLNEEMEIGYQSGINTIYLNSHLYNDFVVRPTFLLEPSETLWVTFKNDVSSPTVSIEPSLLAERKTTVTNSTKQVADNNVSQIEQTADSGYEYCMDLPDAVLANAGEWYFSLEIREIPDSAKPTEYSVISTSDFASFTVNNSLAGVIPGGAPTDLDIAALYRTAVQSAGSAESAAASAAESANEAKQAAEEAQNVVNVAIGEITEIAIERATEAATEATKQAIEEETNRAQGKEAELEQSISNETDRATARENELATSIAAETSTRQTEIEAVNKDIEGLREDITNESHFRGYLATNAEVQALSGTPNDYAYSAESGTVWIYQTDTGWTNSGKAVPDQTTPASNAVPLMDGTGSAGTANLYARGDHRHPSDNTKADITYVDNAIAQAITATLNTPV